MSPEPTPETVVASSPNRDERSMRLLELAVAMLALAASLALSLLR